jgi:transposase
VRLKDEPLRLRQTILSGAQATSGLVHRVLYEQRELKRRTRLYPWATKVGIDENPRTLTADWRWKLRAWLADKPVLRQLYAAREAIFSLYRMRGHRRASKALTRFTDTLALSSVRGLKTLRTTLMRWRREVLARFLCRLTNARTEGFNGKAFGELTGIRASEITDCGF